MPSHGSSTEASPTRVRAESFEQFYRAEYRRAVRLAVALTGSTAVAEDLVQDAMADAHRMWTRLAGYDNVHAWLRRAIEIAPSDRELWGHVRALPDRQAQLLALVYVDGLTIAQAALTLGIATPTAKTHLARAKERLARDLADWSTQ